MLRGILVLCFSLLTISWASAEEGRDASAHQWQTFQLRELPEPPNPLRPLLTRGEILFRFGGIRPSLVESNRSSAGNHRDFAAETRFHLSYSFKTRCRWQWAGSSRQRRLRISIRFERLQLSTDHQIWLREMPERESFWDSSLLRHELDHVRLSSDSRLSARFVQAVRQHQVLELTREESLPLIALAHRRRSAGGARTGSVLSQLTGDDAQPLVDAMVKKEFDRISQLVEIRYQELDRQTDHGRRAVPEGGILKEWLRPR